MLVGLFTMPALINGLGIERFGVLTIAWTVIGYFSLFDMGLGTALTNLISEKLGRRLESEIPSLVSNALALMAVLGILGGTIVAVVSPWLVNSVLNMADTLRSETLKAFLILSLSVPVVIHAAGLRGILEAYQHFGLVNAARILLGLFAFLAPLAILPFSQKIYHVVTVLVFGRFFIWGVQVYFCLQIMPSLRKYIPMNRENIQSLFRFGSWMTVSSIVGPLMLYADRFMISTLISVTAMTYYLTPYEIVIRLLVIPAAIIGVMFPVFSFSFAQKTVQIWNIYSKTMQSVFIIMVPLITIIVLFAKQGLEIWLDHTFASNSFRVAQILAVGMGVNSLGLVSQSFVQASGRPDLTAKLHLIEVPLYLSYLWWLLHAYEIQGAAFAWLMRVTISALALTFMAYQTMKKMVHGVLDEK